MSKRKRVEAGQALRAAARRSKRRDRELVTEIYGPTHHTSRAQNLYRGSGRLPDREELQRWEVATGESGLAENLAGLYFEKPYSLADALLPEDRATSELVGRHDHLLSRSNNDRFNNDVVQLRDPTDVLHAYVRMIDAFLHADSEESLMLLDLGPPHMLSARLTPADRGIVPFAIARALEPSAYDVKDAATLAPAAIRQVISTEALEDLDPAAGLRRFLALLEAPGDYEIRVAASGNERAASRGHHVIQNHLYCREGLLHVTLPAAANDKQLRGLVLTDRYNPDVAAVYHSAAEEYFYQCEEMFRIWDPSGSLVDLHGRARLTERLASLETSPGKSLLFKDGFSDVTIPLDRLADYESNYHDANRTLRRELAHARRVRRNNLERTLQSHDVHHVITEAALLNYVRYGRYTGSGDQSGRGRVAPEAVTAHLHEVLSLLGRQRYHLWIADETEAPGKWGGAGVTTLDSLNSWSMFYESTKLRANGLVSVAFESRDERYRSVIDPAIHSIVSKVKERTSKADVIGKLKFLLSET